MSGTVLVVDDSLTVRMNLTDMLTAADLTVFAGDPGYPAARWRRR
jgi:FixJ family two-component response regulator